MVKTKIKRIPSDTPPSERVAMTMTLEARRRQLLSKMGRSLEEVLRSYEALTALSGGCGVPQDREGLRAGVAAKGIEQKTSGEDQRQAVWPAPARRL